MEENKKNLEEKKEDVKKVEKDKNDAKKQENKEKKVKGKVTVDNKKSKKAPIIAVVIIVLILILAVLAYILYINNSPKKVVDDMFKYLKNGEYDKVSEYVNYEELIDSTNQDAQKLLFDKLSWKITEVSQENETANVTVEITNKDFKTIIGNYMQKVLKSAFSGQDMTDEQTQNYLIEELNNENVSTTTNTSVISLVKQDGKWKISTESNELINMILPGLYDAINSLS